MKKLKRVLCGALMVAALVAAAALASAASEKECAWLNAESLLESFTVYWWPGGGGPYVVRQAAGADLGS